jgi:hypothetical protein
MSNIYLFHRCISVSIHENIKLYAMNERLIARRKYTICFFLFGL